MIPGLKLLLFRTTLFNMLGGFLWINFQMPPTTTIKKNHISGNRFCTIFECKKQCYLLHKYINGRYRWDALN